jgi:antitoxin (DNA-binding transcriptional repressor) of toxin-antitoxin stability system
MPRTITQRELCNKCGEIMRGLDRGEEYTITRNGVPVGTLRPIGRRQFVHADAVAAAFAGAPPIDRGRFRADLDALADPWLPARD